MLTLSGSSRNGNGGWRCPADHLRDVVNSFRPSKGRGVYHALYDALHGYHWEYALVVEHQKTGYRHVHVAIFVDGEITESDFRPAIDAHSVPVKLPIGMLTTITVLTPIIDRFRFDASIQISNPRNTTSMKRWVISGRILENTSARMGGAIRHER